MDNIIIGIALIVLLAAPAVWWAASALRKRNRRREPAEPVPAPTPDPLAALSISLTEGLEGVRSQMSASLGQVRDLLDNLAEQGGQTQERLTAVADSNAALTDATGQLQNLLNDSRSRGFWGERMAEDAIRAAGLLEGVNYRKQLQIANGSTPDFTFLLPEGKVLHMDVKFPLDNYRRHAEAESEAEQGQRLRQFMSDVGRHIKALAQRGYAQDENGVGFVLMFIPVESVWGAILQQKDSLLPHTEARKVVLCSPTTLFPILMMIRNIMDSFQMVAHGQEIIKAVSEFEQQWDNYGEQADKVERHLDTLVKSFGTLTTTRTNVLQRKVDGVSALRSDPPPPPQPAPRLADRQEAPAEPSAA